MNLNSVFNTVFSYLVSLSKLFMHNGSKTNGTGLKLKQSQESFLWQEHQTFPVSSYKGN